MTLTAVSTQLTTKIWPRWRAYLFRPVDGASLAVLRIIFGLLMFWEVLRYFEYGWIDRYYIIPTFHFTYPFFDFVRPWPGAGMYVHFMVMGVLALLIAVGLYYRLAAVLFWLAFTYVFLLDEANYLNHFYLISLISFLLIFVPAHRVFSLERWLFFRHEPELVPQWSLFILRAQMFIIYFYAGIAKLNLDWLQGEPLTTWLAQRSHYPVLGPYFALPEVGLLFSYGGLLLDLSVGFFLLFRKTRPFAFLALAGFHTLNGWLFSIGVFPYLAFGATLIFAEPDWPRWLTAKLKGWISRQPTDPLPPTVRAGGLFSAQPTRNGSQIAVLIFIHSYLALQLLIPLRHFLIPGNVSWTEEGHRFAWHMKLRDKEAELRLFVTDPITLETEEIYPWEELSDRQYRKMAARPYMVIQYAHHVAEQYVQRGQPRPFIWADMQVSLNGRPYAPLLNPNMNLAEAPVVARTPGLMLPLELPLKSEE